jgi:hypothetical protein
MGVMGEKVGEKLPFHDQLFRIGFAFVQDKEEGERRGDVDDEKREYRQDLGAKTSLQSLYGFREHRQP